MGYEKINLAILGASYLQLPLVKKAKSLGFKVICFAWEEGAVCKDYVDAFYPISILNKRQILNECKKNNIGGIISIASDIVVPTISYVASEMGLIANSNNSALQSTNKLLMRKCFASSGLRIPHFWNIKGLNIEDPAINFPLIVKPTDRSGSLGVRIVNDRNELDKAIQESQKVSFINEVIIEQFVQGREISIESISWKGNHHVLAITDKVTTGPPNFVELEHHQPANLPEFLKEEIINITEQALNSLEIEFGAAHTELLITNENEIIIIEVGARMGGDFIGSDLVELSTGYDFLRGVIEICVGEFRQPKVMHSMYSGVYFLCEQSKFLRKYFDSSNQIIVKKEIISDELVNISSSNERNGYLIYKDTKKLELT